jgi:oligoribonuclease NrnB/cAMP/cGMP phosphodiesterase (DHH superfamily)
MNNEQKPVTVYYHAPCPDGFSAAYALWLRFGDEAQYHGLAPDDRITSIQANSKVYIVDRGVDPEDLRILKKDWNCDVTVIDHHDTNRDKLRGADCEVIFDSGRCASVITWSWLFGTPTPRLLSYVQDADLWRFMLRSSKEVSAYTKTVPYEFTEWQRYHRSLETGEGYARVVSDGTAMMRLESRLVSDICHSVERRPVAGYENIPTVACPRILASAVGEALGKTYSDTPFVVMYYREGGYINFSVRNNNPEVHVGRLLAEHYDGAGGHPRAGGFRLTDFPWEEKGLTVKDAKVNRSKGARGARG